ncbi:MAG: methyltransferase domain-containing protein [Candidatus Aminicenantales bacterium]
MRRYLFRAAGLLAMAALSFFLLRPPAKVQNKVVLDDRRPAAAAFREEATLRNVTKKDLSYTIQPNPYMRQPKTRTLKVGSVDRIPTDVPLEIAFDSGLRKVSYAVFPGKPYSFRYDENGLVKVYPGSHGREDAADLAPYVPTPAPVVERMLTMAGVGRDDVVYDIGCGDGRMVIAAAKTYLARGVGIEIDPRLVKECKANARRDGVEGITRFLCMDATKAHIADATVVVLYLLPESLETLKPLFEKELRPGTRIVSHNYRMPGWDDRIVKSEVVPVESGRPHKIYLYRITGGPH